jgi:hypothetical protein
VKKVKTHHKPPADTTVAPVKDEAPNGADASEATTVSDQPTPPPPEPEKSAAPARQLHHLLPDVIKVVCAGLVILVALVILFKPPLLKSNFPKVTYSFSGTTYTDATLYRPLAMPTRYYIELPRKLVDRYHVFAVDRRREIAAVMTNDLKRTFFGVPTINRNDPLGMDLEFRHLDNSVWHVYFLPETILFSNALLTVRLDIK